MIYEMHFPQSSMIYNVTYDDEKDLLVVTFTNGKAYTYEDVPKTIYNDMINAPSVGKYFNSIKSTLKVQK